jgi:hypothetical protein
LSFIARFQRDAGGWLISVIAGLDPAIHLSSKKLDARGKPAHDE